MLVFGGVTTMLQHQEDVGKPTCFSNQRLYNCTSRFILKLHYLPTCTYLSYHVLSPVPVSQLRPFHVQQNSTWQWFITTPKNAIKQCSSTIHLSYFSSKNSMAINQKNGLSPIRGDKCPWTIYPGSALPPRCNRHHPDDMTFLDFRLGNPEKPYRPFYLSQDCILGWGVDPTYTLLGTNISPIEAVAVLCRWYSFSRLVKYGQNFPGG